jgi:hypothetical protein
MHGIFLITIFSLVFCKSTVFCKNATTHLGHSPHKNREGSSPVDLLEEFEKKKKKKTLDWERDYLKGSIFFKEIERLFIY